MTTGDALVLVEYVLVALGEVLALAVLCFPCRPSPAATKSPRPCVVEADEVTAIWALLLLVALTLDTRLMVRSLNDLTGSTTEK